MILHAMEPGADGSGGWFSVSLLRLVRPLKGWVMAPGEEAVEAETPDGHRWITRTSKLRSSSEYSENLEQVLQELREMRAADEARKK